MGRKPLDTLTLDLARCCAAPNCRNAFVTLAGKRGGGTNNRLYCCFECQQAAYRVRRKEKLKNAVRFTPKEASGA